MKKRTCFVIGPMNEVYIDKLHWLANKVVLEILKSKDFHVFTPDVNEVGNIMNHVIKSADRADLVIADITDNNPNVLYEIGLLNAMGRICIPVKQNEDKTSKKDLPPFDIAQYRYFTIESYKTKDAKGILEPVILDALYKKDLGEIPSNPITDFFGVTLSSLSSAHGISRGYFRNFILPSTKGEIEFAESEEKNLIGLKELDIHIIIAEKLEQSSRWMVDLLKKTGKIIPVVLDTLGRKTNAYIWSMNISKKPTLVDIPTAMGQLTENVKARMGALSNKNPMSQDYIELERDEIRQFKTYLQSFINNEPDSPVRHKVKIIDVKDSLCPDLFDY